MGGCWKSGFLGIAINLDSSGTAARLDSCILGEFRKPGLLRGYRKSEFLGVASSLDSWGSLNVWILKVCWKSAFGFLGIPVSLDYRGILGGLPQGWILAFSGNAMYRGGPRSTGLHLQECLCFVG